MTALIDAALDRSRMVLTALLLLLVAGIYAYVAIPREAAPDVDVPVVFVTVTHAGISPEDAERLLARPIEQEVRTIAGLKSLQATAFEDGASLTLEFDIGVDAERARNDVRQRVDRARSLLPAEADPPRVEEVNLSLFPVLVVTLAGDLPERTLLKLARDLQDRIQAIDSVLSAEILGGRAEQVEIIVDPLLAESYGLDASQLTYLAARSNRVVAAGQLDTGDGRFAVKVPGLFQSLSDIWNLPVKANGDAVVRLRDIAEIRRTFRDPETFARVGGQPAIALEVVKRTGANVIETIETVRAAVEAERRHWPEGVSVTFSNDLSAEIRSMLGDLQNNILSAVLLVVVVCVAAMGLRSGLLVGVAIPGSFLTGLLVLHLSGLSINAVVLFALILVVGMLVDGAIIVTEYADRRMLEGMDRRAAYGEAAKRMAWPVVASTATTVVVFLPLLFWPGVVGAFMKFLPITLMATLSASLVMALIFIPTLGAAFGRPGAAGVDRAERDGARRLRVAEAGDPRRQRGLTGLYVRLLDRCLRRPGWVVLAAVALLAAMQVLYLAANKGIEFFPAIEPDGALVRVHARGNLSIHEADRLVREVEGRILALDEFESVYTRVGPLQLDGVIGGIALEFRGWDQRPRPVAEVLAEIRRRTADLAGIEIELVEQDGGPTGGKPIGIELSASDPSRLPAALAHIRRGLEEIGGFEDVEDSRTLPGIEWSVEVDRAEAAKFGADVSAVGDAIRLVTNGLYLGAYRPGDSRYEIDIVLRYPREERTLLQLDDIRIQTSAGLVPLSNFVERKPQPRMGAIHRVSQRQVMTVAADVRPGLLVDDKIRQIQAWLDTHPLEDGVTYTLTGQEEDRQESRGFLILAFVVALFLIAIVLLIQFNSFYDTALILGAVVMSIIGVEIGLIVTGQPFSIVMSGIGVIALAGIVVNNNIVLIDTYRTLIREFPSNAREALLRTGAQRLRPVALTTITTILGLVPMALQANIDFLSRQVTVGSPSTQSWVGLATAIIFGLAFSTLLTLIVTPCAMLLRTNLRARREARRAQRIRTAWAAETGYLDAAD